MERGTGVTTRQIKEAPQGAIFVWPHADTDYPKRIAHGMGRDDLLFCCPDDLPRLARSRGRRVVVDHAAKLNMEQWEEVQRANARP